MSTFILKGIGVLLVLMGTPFLIFYLTLGYERMPDWDVAAMMFSFYVFFFLVALGSKLLIRLMLQKGKPKMDELELQRIDGKWAFILSRFGQIALPSITAITIGFFLSVFVSKGHLRDSLPGYFSLLAVTFGAGVLIASALWDRNEKRFLIESKKDIKIK